MKIEDAFVTFVALVVCAMLLGLAGVYAPDQTFTTVAVIVALFIAFFLGYTLGTKDGIEDTIDAFDNAQEAIDLSDRLLRENKALLDMNAGLLNAKEDSHE
jgi:hypothetical protein